MIFYETSYFIINNLEKSKNNCKLEEAKLEIEDGSIFYEALYYYMIPHCMHKSKNICINIYLHLHAQTLHPIISKTTEIIEIINLKIWKCQLKSASNINCGVKIFLNWICLCQKTLKEQGQIF